MDATLPALMFRCPRCANEVEERFYGPCGPCRDELAALLVGEARERATEHFEPAMNVVPNQVATKD
jgi:hypothetical protein